MYTFIRYERTGDTVTPVRVTKQMAAGPTGPVCKVTRITRVPWGKLAREVAVDAAGTPASWVSSDRVESRDRVLGLVTSGDAAVPVLTPAGAGLPFLPATDTDVGDAHGWSLANSNGWDDEA